MRKFLPIAAAVLGVIASPSSVFAHSGHGAAFALPDGFLHPLHGLDHLLAVFAVGLWAVQLRGPALWALPAAFVGAMTIGALAAISGVTVVGFEAIIIASVVVLGAALALRSTPPLSVAVLVCSVFALAHGAAHGGEIPDNAGIAAYVAGFVAATALLHLSGVAAGWVLTRSALAARLVGAAIAASGVALAVS